MPVGNVSYRGSAGIGNAGAGMGTAGAIARKWLGMAQAPGAAPPSTPDQDAAFATAFGLPGAPPPAPVGIEGAPPMPGQQFAQGGAIPPMHPRGQPAMPPGGPPVPVSRPPVGGQPVGPPPTDQAQAGAPGAPGGAAPPSRMGRAGGAALQYLAQQIGQRQGPLY